MQPPWSIQEVELPVTVDTDAYTDGDVVGGTLTSEALDLISGQGAFISSGRLVDAAGQEATYELYIYDATPSTIADDAAHAPTLADELKCLGRIPIATYRTETAASVAIFAGKDTDSSEYVELPMGCGRFVYARLVLNGSTPTYTAATDLTLHLKVWAS